ncbi:MAG: DUF177 domain-containing protein [Syntrophobacterales bacterium]|nr:DUF177 domain-containing protein [Syntrophobacterales bacterium]
MKLRIEDIKDEGVEISLMWSRVSLSAFMAPNDPYEIDFSEPLDVHLIFKKKPNCVHVSGTVKGALIMTCHRCLDHFSWILDLPLETFLYDKSYVDKGVAEEVELEDKDLEEEFFDGEEIDVDLIIAEEIFLALPQVLLCSEDCKGLCSHCGANLNRESCTCKRAGNSPFSALLRRKHLLPLTR